MDGLRRLWGEIMKVKVLKKHNRYEVGDIFDVVMSNGLQKYINDGYIEIVEEVDNES